MLKAQDRTLFNMPDIQQSTLINPAIQHNCGLFIGLPAISSLSFNIANTGFEYKDVFKKLNSGSYAIDIKNLEKKLRKWNYLKSNLNINIFAIGYKFNDYYFSFDISNKTDLKLGYPDDYIKISHGNGNFLGENYLQLAPFFSAVNYNEFALGISKTIDFKLTIGGKLKYINGTANAQITNSYFKLYTDEDMYDLKAVADIETNISFPVSISYDTLNFPSDAKINDFDIRKDFLFNGNRGGAIDIGAIYKFNELITISASLLDIGFIKWKKNTHTYQGKGEFAYDGVDISKYVGKGIFKKGYNLDSLLDIIKNEYADSLQKSYNLSNNSSSYYSFLHPKLYAGATYNYSEQLNFGLLSRTAFFNKRLYPSVTLSANSNFWKNRFQASLSYSVMNNSFKNLGVGLGFKLGPVQIYAISDNFLAAFNPKTNRSFSLHFGINFMFYCTEKEIKNKTRSNNFSYGKRNSNNFKNKKRNIRNNKKTKGKGRSNNCPAYK